MLYQRLKDFGHTRANEPMSKHTTFKIGGPAEFFVTVTETDKLIELLGWLDGEGVPYFVLGGGSNMLVRDEGFFGVVIEVKTHEARVKNQVLEAEAGCNMVAMAQLSIQNGLTDFEWGVGVPGTIGGAVRGNAGAMGREMKDCVASVTAYRDGEVATLSKADCAFGYRDSFFKHHQAIVLSVALQLTATAEKDGLKKAMEYLQYRNKTQPQGFASTGCIFKNYEVGSQESRINPDKVGKELRENLLTRFPEDAEKISTFFEIGKISAGWLVEKSGMKGAQIGDAWVSDRHGNFVVNRGHATASDVLALIEQIKEKVYTATGIQIEEEIQII